MSVVNAAKVFVGSSMLRIVSMPAQIVVVALIVRTYPISEVGLFFAVQSLMPMLAAISNGGVVSSGPRILAESRTKSRVNGRFWWGVLQYLTVCSLVSIGLTLLASHFLLGPENSIFIDAPLLLFVVLWALVVGLNSIVVTALQYKRLVTVSVLLEQGGLIRQVLVLFFLVCSMLFVSNPSVIEFFGALFATHLIIALIGLTTLYSQSFFSCSYSSVSFLRLLKQSVPLLLVKLVTPAFIAFEMLIVANYLGSSTLAHYRSATKISELLMMVPMFVAPFLVGRVAILHVGNDLKGLQDICSKAYFVTFIISSFIFLAFFIAGEILLIKMYGPDFGADFDVLLLRALGYFFASLCGPAILVLSHCNKQNVMLVATLILLPIEALLIYFGVNWGGALGAAIGASVGMSTRYFIYFLLAWKFVGVRTIDFSFSSKIITKLIR